MAEVKILLADDQESEFKKYLYQLTLDVLNQARKDLHMDRDLLNKKEMASWLGISQVKLDELIREGMPISILGERTFFLSKQEVRNWILTHNKK